MRACTAPTAAWRCARRQAEPAVPYRRLMLVARVRVDYAPEGGGVLRAEPTLALGRIAGLADYTEALTSAIARLFVLLLTAAVVFVRGSQNAASSRYMLQHTIDVMRCRKQFAKPSTRCTRSARTRRPRWPWTPASGSRWARSWRACSCSASRGRADGRRQPAGAHRRAGRHHAVRRAPVAALRARLEPQRGGAPDQAGRAHVGRRRCHHGRADPLLGRAAPRRTTASLRPSAGCSSRCSSPSPCSRAASSRRPWWPRWPPRRATASGASCTRTSSCSPRRRSSGGCRPCSWPRARRCSSCAPSPSR